MDPDQRIVPEMPAHSLYKADDVEQFRRLYKGYLVKFARRAGC